MLGWLHDRMPRSLLGRAALILLLPVAILQLAVSVAFVDRYYDDVTRQMTRSLVLELRYLSDAVARAPDPPAARAAARAIGRPLALDVALPDPAPRADRRRPWDLAGRAMAATLRRDGPGLLALDLETPRRVALWLATPHGDLRVSFARSRVAASNPHQLLVWTVGLGLLVTGVSLLFLRNQVRPLRALAAAAAAYGRGRVLPYRPSGASEVRAAGTAFLDMRARIERQAQARTTMLAGVSHDLRTPLTRMRLALSLMEGEDAAALLRDVADMERMVDAFLLFARDDARDGAEEAREAADLALLARQVADSDPLGRVELRVLSDLPPLTVAATALRRAIQNLVDNALAHGTRAVVTLSAGDRAVRVTVEDDGPGIPPDRREEALRPFVRLDAGRNQDRPGVGLGLAIVADVARGHGGSLRLGESALGGLRADLVLAR